MSNEVVIKSGKVLALGDATVELVDEGAPIHFVDLLTENRQNLGTVYLSFASLKIDAANAPEAVIATRLRMSVVMAQNLRDVLSGLIENALKPADQSKAN